MKTLKCNPFAILALTSRGQTIMSDAKESNQKFSFLVTRVGEQPHHHQLHHVDSHVRLRAETTSLPPIISLDISLCKCITRTLYYIADTSLS